MKERKTSREINAYLRYRQSTEHYLKTVYKNPSWAKERAEAEIIQYMLSINGRDYRIISHNMNTFSAGFIAEENGKTYFYYFTANNETKTCISDPL